MIIEKWSIVVVSVMFSGVLTGGFGQELLHVIVEALLNGVILWQVQVLLRSDQLLLMDPRLRGVSAVLEQISGTRRADREGRTSVSEAGSPLILVHGRRVLLCRLIRTAGTAEAIGQQRVLAALVIGRRERAQTVHAVQVVPRGQDFVVQDVSLTLFRPRASVYMDLRRADGQCTASARLVHTEAAEQPLELHSLLLAGLRRFRPGHGPAVGAQRGAGEAGVGAGRERVIGAPLGSGGRGDPAGVSLHQISVQERSRWGGRNRRDSLIDKINTAWRKQAIWHLTLLMHFVALCYMKLNHIHPNVNAIQL